MNLSASEWFEWISLIFAGLLAGTEFAVRFGIKGPLDQLDIRSHIVIRQGLIRTLRIIAPSFFFPALLLGAAPLLYGEDGVPFILRLCGIAMLLLWLGVTFGGTVPINSSALEWQPEKPPANFNSLIHRWESLALIRVFASLAAFIFFIFSSMVV